MTDDLIHFEIERRGGDSSGNTVEKIKTGVTKVMSDSADTIVKQVASVDPERKYNFQKIVKGDGSVEIRRNKEGEEISTTSMRWAVKMYKECEFLERMAGSEDIGVLTQHDNVAQRKFIDDLKRGGIRAAIRWATGGRLFHWGR